jgi:predicted O-methyltransferase YrrM
LFQIIAYIKYLFRSTNQHGVHSPFVYDLLTKCLYRREPKPGFGVIDNYIQTILKDHRTIRIKDFGAGSRVFKSDERKVSAIARNAGISRKRAFLLNKLTSYFNIYTALELGTSVGISSAAIAAGNKVALTTLEGCPETAKVASEYFERFGIDNIEVKIGEFESLLKMENSQIINSKLQTIPEPQPTDNQQPTNHIRKLTTDLIYFDGNHQKQATLHYFHQLLPLAHNDSVFIFDDIHWSKGMEEAWEEIKGHPEVRVSIDSFFWGIVFFRREQKKEHFTIRM